MSVRLWLVRHGSTDWFEAGRLNGWTDIPLNDHGRLQARALATRLDGLAFAGVWSSDLQRAMETARLAAGGAVADPRLRELDFGILEGRRWAEIPIETRDALAAFDGFEAPRGESVADLGSRVFAFVDALSEGDHLVFTHGGVIRLLLRRAGLGLRRTGHDLRRAGHDQRVLPGELVHVVIERSEDRASGAER